MPERPTPFDDSRADPPVSGERTLFDIADRWHGSGKDATPEEQRQIGEIRRQWHRFVRIKEESGESLTTNIPYEDVEHGTLPHLPPIGFGHDPESGGTLLAYPALGASYYPADRDGRDIEPHWQITYHPFRMHAENQNERMEVMIAPIMEAAEFQRTMKDMLQEAHQAALAELVAYANRPDSDSSELFLNDTDDPERQRLQERLIDLASMRSKLSQSATYVTGDPHRSMELSSEVFDVLPPRRTSDATE